MSTEQTTQLARYQSLRDYLAVLRRYRIMIAIITIIGAGAGLANALREKPVYQASAEVAFQDPTQALGVVGLAQSTPQTPAQIAAVNSETATGPSVMKEVRRRLKAHQSVGALTGAVATQVFVGSGLLQITASSGSPTFAAKLANSVANVLASKDNQQTRAQFVRLASSIRRKIAQLKSGQGGTPIQAQFYENELARLEALTSFATTARVERPAQPPSGPSSPNKARDTALGALLGLLLGIIAAFVRDSLDRRIRKPSDFESAFEQPVIGHVRKQSMGRIAYLSSNGTKQMDKLDLESFRILRRNLEFLDFEKGVKTVLVTSAVAEEGKTTVATSLALVMAAAGRQTLLVDCDLRRPDLAARMHVDQTPGISEYLAGTASPPDILRTVTFGDSPTPDSAQNGTGGIIHNLVCIPAGSATSRASELLGSRRFQEFLEQVKDKYDMVVLDSSPLLPVADTLEMLPYVDAVIVCAREAQTTRDQARAVNAALARFPKRPTGIVATGMKPRGAEYEAYAYSYNY